MGDIQIDIITFIGNPICVEANDGKKVYRAIHKALKEKQKVTLSFQNVEILTAAFFNAAIGHLCRNYDDEFIKKNVMVTGLSIEDQALLKRVNNTARLYYKNPERMRKSMKEILGE